MHTSIPGPCAGYWLCSCSNPCCERCGVFLCSTYLSQDHRPGMAMAIKPLGMSVNCRIADVDSFRLAQQHPYQDDGAKLERTGGNGLVGYTDLIRLQCGILVFGLYRI